MSETIGTLNLRIARLQRRLTVLSLQEKMSQAYPAHKARLLQESRRLRQEISQLDQLTERQKLPG